MPFVLLVGWLKGRRSPANWNPAIIKHCIETKDVDWELCWCGSSWWGKLFQLFLWDLCPFSPRLLNVLKTNEYASLGFFSWMNNNVNQGGLCTSALYVVQVQPVHLTPLSIPHNAVLNSATADVSSVQINSPVSKMPWSLGVFNCAVHCILYRLRTLRSEHLSGSLQSTAAKKSGWETKRICENLPRGHDSEKRA